MQAIDIFFATIMILAAVILYIDSKNIDRKFKELDINPNEYRKEQDHD